MRQDATQQTTAQSPPDTDRFDDVTGYEDDGRFVVCETTNPAAWVRSDVTTAIRR